MKLDRYFEWSARETPEAEFARQGDRRISFAEARDEVTRMAAALRASGLAPGDRFIYLSKNSIEFVLAYLAASVSGTVIVPLNYRLAPPEWSGIIADSAAMVVVARGDHLVEAATGLRDAHPGVKEWVAIDGAVPPGWRDYRDWLAAAPGDPVSAASDELCQMYTSGTTGQPKGAILTHESVTTNAWQVCLTLPEPVRRGRRVLLVMPVFHAGAAGQIFGGVVFGASFVIHEDFDPAAVVRSLSEDEIASTSLVPAMIRACLTVAESETPARRYDSLITMFYGASPIDSNTLRRALEAFRCPFFQAYGMTETSTVMTVLSGADHERALAGRDELLLSAGRAIPGTELGIVDAEGRPVPAGTPGQVVARGPQVMKGYWRRAEASAAALAGGWMHTGDVGYLDRDGYLFLLDRLNDTINSGGENIYPREVEDVILSHPEVADGSVFGVPDDRWGEAVLAVVVRKPGSELTETALTQYCRARIAGYKVPRDVVFAATLPRTATGKVLKRELREPYWRGRTRRVG